MPKESRPVPRATPETQHFWDGTKAGELRLQRCVDCKHVYFPPRPFCPSCSSRSVSVFKASGRGRLLSYVINQRPHPAWNAPYSIAIVELDEGPRMMTNLVGVDADPRKIRCDMPVVIDYADVTPEVTLPRFRPAQG